MIQYKSNCIVFCVEPNISLAILIVFLLGNSLTFPIIRENNYETINHSKSD